MSIIKVKNGGYRPLTDGLIAELEPHMDLDTLKDHEGMVDGYKVLGMFDFHDCLLNRGTAEDDEEHHCVCGHSIRNLFWITSGQVPHRVLVGMCCVKKFEPGNPKLVTAAKAHVTRHKALQRVMAEPEVRCVCCGKKRVPRGSIAHKSCRDSITPLLIEMSKPTEFIKSIRDRRRLTEGQVSALTSTRFWNNAQRIAVFRKHTALAEALAFDQCIV